jgi:hypothetical protein
MTSIDRNGIRTRALAFGRIAVGRFGLVYLSFDRVEAHGEGAGGRGLRHAAFHDGNYPAS